MGPLANALIMLLCSPLMGLMAAALVIILSTLMEGWGTMIKAIKIGGEPDDYDPLEPKKPKAKRWPYSELNKGRNKPS